MLNKLKHFFINNGTPGPAGQQTSWAVSQIYRGKGNNENVCIWEDEYIKQHCKTSYVETYAYTIFPHKAINENVGITPSMAIKGNGETVSYTGSTFKIMAGTKVHLFEDPSWPTIETYTYGHDNEYDGNVFNTSNGQVTFRNNPGGSDNLQSLTFNSNSTAQMKIYNNIYLLPKGRTKSEIESMTDKFMLSANCNSTYYQAPTQYATWGGDFFGENGAFSRSGDNFYWATTDKEQAFTICAIDNCTINMGVNDSAKYAAIRIHNIESDSEYRDLHLIDIAKDILKNNVLPDIENGGAGLSGGAGKYNNNTTYMWQIIKDGPASYDVDMFKGDYIYIYRYYGSGSCSLQFSAVNNTSKTVARIALTDGGDLQYNVAKSFTGIIEYNGSAPTTAYISGDGYMTFNSSLYTVTGQTFPGDKLYCNGQIFATVAGTPIQDTIQDAFECITQQTEGLDVWSTTKKIKLNTTQHSSGDQIVEFKVGRSGVKVSVSMNASDGSECKFYGGGVDLTTTAYLNEVNVPLTRDETYTLQVIGNDGVIIITATS